MRAGVLVAPGRFELQELSIPEPGPGQVLVRLEGCGVCASNIPPFQGREWFEYPFAPGNPGHEGWGVIEGCGPEVTGWRAGERVTALSERAYAEYDLADVQTLVRIPADLAGKPFPGEPLGCAMNIFRRAGIEAGQTVAVVGVGFLGALLCGLAAREGARVIAISRRATSLEIARRYGAEHVLPLGERWEVVGRVEELTSGGLCERVIECTGKQEPLELAGELTGTRGRLVIAGFHQDGLRQVNLQLWNWRGLDVINAHERDPAVYRRGMEEALAAVASGRLDPGPLFTHTYPLERLTEALQAAEQRPEGFVKALVMMGGEGGFSRKGGE